MNMQCFNCPFDSSIVQRLDRTIAWTKWVIRNDVSRCRCLVIERVSYAELTKVSFHFTCICFSWVDTWFLVKILGLVIWNQKAIKMKWNQHSNTMNQAWIKPESTPLSPVDLEIRRTSRNKNVWNGSLQEYRRDVDRQMEAGNFLKESSSQALLLLVDGRNPKQPPRM